MATVNVKLILTTPKFAPGSVIEMSGSFTDPLQPTIVDSFICQTNYVNDSYVKSATYTVFDIKSNQMPYKTPMGATPASSYSAYLDTKNKPAGTSDWTVTASLNNCQTYICTFECDVTRPLTTSDVNDV